MLKPFQKAAAALMSAGMALSSVCARAEESEFSKFWRANTDVLSITTHNDVIFNRISNGDVPLPNDIYYGPWIERNSSYVMQEGGQYRLVAETFTPGALFVRVNEYGCVANWYAPEDVAKGKFSTARTALRELNALIKELKDDPDSAYGHPWADIPNPCGAVSMAPVRGTAVGKLQQTINLKAG